MATGLKDFVSWLGIIGIPSIFAILAALGKWLVKVGRQIDILQRAQKAQMRSQLLIQYETYMETGWISQIQLDDWMNQYKAYHTLVGDNEILDSRKTDLINLPNKPILNQLNQYLTGSNTTTLL